MSDIFKDPIALFQAVETAQRNSAELEAKYAALTKKVFSTESGREWFVMALAKNNFMGSVFDKSFDDRAAAYRDGIRSVFSEILNSAAMAGASPNPFDDE